ncbi:MAG: hypothetical protein DLM50_06455 [Candidatus Meridianibacter frigidus]|nr:MAG: hypothetical protein DLM50_06455 [Candidatus Eremiobacteraeota bacterium]
MNDKVHVSVESPAGSYTVGNTSFFRYIVRLAEMGLTLRASERESVEMLASIPHAFFDDGITSGNGWRIVPPISMEDWPVMQATPQRLRSALQTARRILWENAAPVGVTAGEIVTIEEELDQVFGVLQQAEAAGFPVNVSYVS